jgi:hypothetical protein
MTTLDDLLTYEEEEPPKPTSHRERPSRWLLKMTLLAAGAALLVYLLLRLFGLDVPYLLIFCLLLTLILVRRVMRDLQTAPVPGTLRRAPTAAPDGDGDGGWGERDGLELATTRWHTRLSWLHTRRDPRQFARTVQPHLVQIIEERLRLRHGVSVSADPIRARALLGDPLWTFVSQPVAKNPSPRELAALVKTVEDL